MAAGEIEEPVDALGDRSVVDVVHVSSGTARWQSCSTGLRRGRNRRDSFLPPFLPLTAGIAKPGDGAGQEAPAIDTRRLKLSRLPATGVSAR
jgi:hypothetical protein